MEEKSFSISWTTIFKVAAVFFAAYLVYLIHDILVLSVFGLVISILFETPVRLLEKKMPRALAILFLYIFVFVVISLLIYLPATQVVAEVGQFIKFFPLYFEQISPGFRILGIEAFKDLDNFTQAIEQMAQVMTSNVLNVLFNIFGGISSTIFVISMAIFLSLEKNSVQNALALLFSEQDRRFIQSLWRRSQKNVGFWFLRTFIGCLFIGLISYIAFLILKAGYPLSLSIIGGALNFVPIIGPVLAGFLIFIVLALESLPKALIGLLIYVIVQQIENNILSPMLSKKMTGISPILVLISLAAGGKLFGILGAILTVPLMGIIVEFVRGVLERKREEAEQTEETGEAEG